MPFAVVRTDVRPVSYEVIASALALGHRVRDQARHPERRRDLILVGELQTALHLARVLARTGPVRAGRHRIKVVRLGPPPNVHQSFQ